MVYCVSEKSWYGGVSVPKWLRRKLLLRSPQGFKNGIN
jgi:hypothetical protein